MGWGRDGRSHSIKASIARRIGSGRRGQAATIRAKSSKLVQALVQAPAQCLKYVAISWVTALRSPLPKLDVAGSSPVARS